MKARETTTLVLRVGGIYIMTQSLHYVQTAVVACYANQAASSLARTFSRAPSYPWWITLIPFVLLVGAGLILVSKAATISNLLVREESDVQIVGIDAEDLMTMGIALVGLFFGTAGFPQFLQDTVSAFYADRMAEMNNDPSMAVAGRVRLLADALQVGIGLGVFVKARRVAGLVRDLTRPKRNDSAEPATPPYSEPAARSPQG